jgi:Flp pilus assembly protein TadD
LHKAGSNSGWWVRKFPLDLLLEGNATFISILLFVLVAWVFLPSLHNGFVSLDDPLYLEARAPVQSGLSLENIRWAFTNVDAGFWQPLTWLSVMLDCELFGLRPGGHHLTSLLLHAANAVLVFLVFQRMTRATWRSAMVAALFALHPLHVETVAWVADRKDVLCVFFWMLSMLMYVGYVQRSGSGNGKSEGPGNPGRAPITSVHYWLALLFFGCALMSKTMAVTVPFILVLMDWWPLRRLETVTLTTQPAIAARRSTLLLEKLPFLAAGFVCGLVTVHSQRAMGALPATSELPVTARISNALLSYGHYLGQTFWPAGLSADYPHSRSFAGWHVAGALLLGLTVTALVVGEARRRPYLAFGWSWYVVTLLPVVGLIQIGGHARADRYTYLPLIGVFTLVTWSVSDLTKRWRYRAVLLPACALAVIFPCMALTRQQLGYWKSNDSLLRHVLLVAPDSALAHNNLGETLLRKGQLDEAIGHFREATRLAPDDPVAQCNLGIALDGRGRPAEAISHLRQAARLAPADAHPHYNLGVVLLRKGEVDEAIAELEEAVRLASGGAGAARALDPGAGRPGLPPQSTGASGKFPRVDSELAEAHCKLGVALGMKGRPDEAIAHLEEALRLNPGYADAYWNLGVELGREARLDEAIARFRRALEIQPDMPAACYDLGIALLRKGRVDEALVAFQNVTRVQPDNARAHNDLGTLLLQKGRVDEAIAHYERAIELEPDQANLLNNLAWVLATSPQASARNGTRAVELAQKADQLSGGKDPAILGTLAAAQAESGRFPEAVSTALRASELASARSNAAQADALRVQIELYRAGSPVRDAGQTNTAPGRDRP